jgi:hypothetical protein
MIFDPAKAAIVVDRIAEGHRLVDIGRDIGVERRTILRWQQANEEFCAQCAHARVLSAQVNEESIATLVDEVQRGSLAPDAARVALNGLTWLAKVRAPKVYGDKLEMAGTLTVDVAAILAARKTPGAVDA